MILEFDPKSPRFCATFDHIIPVVHGGTWDPENLLLAHQDCNNRRGNQQHVICLPPPKPQERFTFKKPNKRRRFTELPVREVRPERPSNEVPWSVRWMIDKGLMNAPGA